MKYPTWNEFIGKNNNDPENAFEALCRLLFKTRYGIGDSLPYFYNHPGIETTPIKSGDEIIGFQSKFFTGETISDVQANEFINKIKKAKEHHPNLTKIILCTNLAFWFPSEPNEGASKRQRRVEKACTDLGLSFEWMFGYNILDVVPKTPLAYDLFFDLGSNTSHLPIAINKYNERRFKGIDSIIKFRGQDIQLERAKQVSEIVDQLEQHNNILIYGESGSGKSAIVKQYWDTIKETGTAFYFLNGSQLGTGSVNDLFRLEEDFTFTSFRDFYSGTERKVIYIDSAEKLLEQPNLLAFQILTEELSDKGWQFVFTCKTASLDALQTTLRDYSIKVSTIEIKEISEEELSGLEKEYHIPSPQNGKIQKQIRIPFYLARYCEFDGVSAETPLAFRDLVWKMKVRGGTVGPEQQKREECLFKIVRALQEKGTYLVALPDIDHSAAFALENEDILINYGYRGYAIKHDIYTDWALEYIIERDFDTAEHGISILKEVPQSLTYLNAFKRWLHLIVDSDNVRAEKLIDAYAAGVVNEKWESAILGCIGASSEYAYRFFAKYDANLKADKYSLFSRLVDVLYVSCQQIVSYFEFKGDKYPIMQPVGAGWHEAVRFLYENRVEYYMGHTNAVYKLLQSYSSLGWEAKERRNAAVLSLCIFDEVATSRINGNSFWLDKPKPWCSLLCSYAPAIYKELEDRFQQVLDNHWVKHTDPYAELVAFILRDSEYITTTYPVCLACPKHIIKLMELFWREQTETDEDRSWPYRSMHENDYNNDYWFGLNKKFDNGISYFPASGFQTPITPLLNVEKKVYADALPVLKFIIRFIDECVELFSKRCRDFHEPVNEIEVKLWNGETHQVMSNQGLWNLYRGTSSISAPHLIECIHMALETFLLDQILGVNKENEESHQYVHKVVRYILEHSHSVSLYSVVASIAMASPKEFFDELLFLCQDIRFLSYDITRYSSERTAGFMTGGLPTKEHLYEERKKSNAHSHRQIHLEQALLFRQIDDANHEDEESQTRLKQAFAAVDSLKDQVEEMREAPSTYRFILARLDYRTMKKETVTLKNGVQAMQYTPSLSKDLQAESDAITNNQAWMRGVNLNVWTEKMFEGDEKGLQGLHYGEDVQQVLSDLRIIEKQFNEKSPQLFALHGDEYLPFKASAVLLIKKKDSLDENERQECWNRIMEALKSPRFLVGHSMTGINICLNAIPVMMCMYPERVGEFSSIIATYSSVRDEYINTRICDIMSFVIEWGNLWSSYPIVMEDALNSIRERIADKDFNKMDADQANAVLCLLTPKTEYRILGKTCILKIAKLWEPKPHHDMLDRTYQDSGLVARYVLNAPKEEVESLIEPYVNLLDTEHDYETLLTSILIYCVNNNRYENFWIIWNSFFAQLKKTVRTYYNGQLLNTYLLNPPYLTPMFANWFRLEEKDLAFFDMVVQEMPRHPAVINALSKVFSTIGKQYSKHAIGLFAHIVNSYGERSNLKEAAKGVIENLEKVINHAYSEYENEFRMDQNLRSQLVDLLDFMIKNGSQTASFMREKL